MLVGVLFSLVLPPLVEEYQKAKSKISLSNQVVVAQVRVAAVMSRTAATDL
jgi:hypothetical protein